MSSITQTEATKRHRPRPDYLRVVPEPGPGIPARPCPAWCTVGNHEHGDLFHYGTGIDAAGVTVNPEILDDGTRVARLQVLDADAEYLDPGEIGELIAALNEVRATLTGTLVAA